MTLFRIYGKPDCVWCERAKDLITSKGDTFKFLELGIDFDMEELQSTFGNIKTVPQIIYEDNFGWIVIGPYTALEKYYGSTGSLP